MAPDKKTYDPQEAVTITLTVEEWDTVLHWLKYGADYHHAKTQEWLANCQDKKMAGEIAAGHKRDGTQAENLAKIIEAALYPAPPPPETE